MNFKTSLLATLAIIAFAGNSVLCRLALAMGTIDPASFTMIRLLSGAVALFLLISVANFNRSRSDTDRKIVSQGWVGPLALFAYAALFSFAYVSLDTGVGALILFGSVQISMLSISLIRGTRLNLFEVLGLLIACAGLIYLVYPELSKPSISGFIMMLVAGIAWGIYTINGQGSAKPLRDTASNFVKSLPFAAIVAVAFIDSSKISAEGLLLAATSGAVTSGIAYAVWYAALRDLNTSQAAVLQLLVPVVAALGGVLFADELLSARLAISAALTLGGLFLVLVAKIKRVD